MPMPLQWDGQPGPAHVDTVETANRLYNFLPQALHRIHGAAGAPLALQAATLAPLAVGGGMAVYKITALLQSQQIQYLVCKIPHQRRIVYTATTDHQTTEDTTYQLLDRLVALADRLTQRALSVERLKHHYEQQWMANQLSADLYRQHRTAVERLAVATFVRLWDALDRRLFTSDPSPWNILVHPPDAMPDSQPGATIIDLHGLEDDVGLTYVVQRLASVYGMRQDILEDVLIPGVFDALGVAAGTALLRAELPQLEAEAERMRQNLGVDVQQPLIHLIRTLA